MNRVSTLNVYLSEKLIGTITNVGHDRKLMTINVLAGINVKEDMQINVLMVV